MTGDHALIDYVGLLHRRCCFLGAAGYGGAAAFTHNGTTGVLLCVGVSWQCRGPTRKLCPILAFARHVTIFRDLPIAAEAMSIF